MTLLSIILMLLLGGGAATLAWRSRPAAACRIGAWSAVAAMTGVLLCAVAALRTGEFDVALYLLPIALTGGAAALYAPGYLLHHGGRHCGWFWLFFNLTLGMMTLVVLSMDYLPFLVAWEGMGLASFLLVIFERPSPAARRAGWIYLAACEAGGMLLMLAWVLQNRAGSSPLTLAILLLTGFGLKAGFPLLHVWLPEAHPAAPAPVSAVMSGAMIPLGFCGLFRFLPPEAQLLPVIGWSLLVLGGIGAFGGILFGMVQQDLKRLLAYSSVENIGIMALGFGLATLGMASGDLRMAAFGLAGAALHVLNHALLKGTLFLSAGTVLVATGTLQMDKLGGLMKTLPRTGACFTLAALGICGLPPFCGFTGELLIYLAAFHGIAHASGALFAGAFAAAVVLALTGALACAALVKATAAVFLGEPRSACAREALPETPGLYGPLALLTIPALLMPLFIPWFMAPLLPDAAAVLFRNALFTLVAGAVFGVLWLLRTRKKDAVRRPGTWDCGFAEPTARMEYTGSALIQPLAELFNGLLRQQKTVTPPEGLFPDRAEYAATCEDPGERGFWAPLLSRLAALAEKVHRFQSGYLHLYVLIMTLALLLMLLWSFCGNGSAAGGQ